MARTDLSRLLDTIDTDEPAMQVGPVPNLQVEAASQSKPAGEGTGAIETSVATPEDKSNASAGRGRRAAVNAPAPSVSTTPKEPLYLQLVRKETRLREEQYETLTEYARKLNRAKDSGSTERITENTLIRIAVDLLIPHLGNMRGNDESQLRNSVSNRKDSPTAQ